MKKKIQLFALVYVCFIFFSLIIPVNSISSSFISGKNGEENTAYDFAIGNDTVTTRSAGTFYEIEPNNTSSFADRTYDDYDNYGKISTTSDVDWWVVKFSGSGYANFWLGNIPSGCDYDLKLFDSDGTTMLKYSMKFGNSDELIEAYWVTANKNYYIKIYSYSGSSSSSNYWFRTRNYPYHQYAGFVKSGENKGISARITTPSVLPDVSDSGESVWVSTSKDSNGEWIQTGARYYSSFTAFKTYTEHYESGIYKMTTVGTHNLGASITYKVEYHSSDNKWHAYIADTDKVSSSLATINNSVQAQAEVHKKYIEMGPFTFASVSIMNSSGTWVNNTVTPTANSPYTVTGIPTYFTVSGP